MTRRARSVLVVPMPPTPNGRLHVGHGAGTYLRADVVARGLRVRGDHVLMIFGTDVYENWILAEARRISLTPEETCDHYHEAIHQDLTSVGVEIDVWVDVRAPEHDAAYRELHEEVLARLVASGAARIEEERIPYSRRTGRAVVGTFITGRCPRCGAACSGNSCVVCGNHLQPEELAEPRSRLDDAPLEWRTERNYFARPLDAERIERSVEETRGATDAFREGALRYLRATGGRVRLTSQGDWGLASPRFPEGTVFGNSYYIFAVYCGEVFSRVAAMSVHPFAPTADVLLVGAFGSDNTTPGLVAPRVVADGSAGALKPFDATVVHGMLYFEGQKCSTSKRHGIWLSELIGSGVVSSDELRLALLRTPLERGHENLTLREIVERVNELRRWTERVESQLGALCTTNGALRCGDRLFGALDRQHELLDPAEADIAGAAAIFRDWTADLAPPDAAEWLVGVALLGEPFVPRLARMAWTRLGLAGAPRVEPVRGVDRAPPPSSSRTLPNGRGDLRASDLTPYVHLAA